MSILQPPILSTLVVKTEPPTVIKNEPPEPEIMSIDFDEDIKYIDIVSHPLSEDLIKSETVPENIIFESKHSEYVEAQAYVKAENDSLVQIENIIECEKTEDTDDGNGTWDTGQEAVEVQGIHTKHPKKTDYARCHKTLESNLWKKEKEKIKVIKAAVIQFRCAHCDYKTRYSANLKRHNLIHLKPKESQYFYCDNCSFKSRDKSYVKRHIFRLHDKNVESEQKRFSCYHCDYKTQRRGNLKTHNLIHLKPEDVQYFYCSHCSFKTKYKKNLSSHQASRNCKNIKIEQKRFRCDYCDYKTRHSASLKMHSLIHLYPEEVQYFYCSHCSFKSKRKNSLRAHILRHFQNQEVKFCCYICDFMTLEREFLIYHIRKHSKVRNKSKINEGN